MVSDLPQVALSRTSPTIDPSQVLLQFSNFRNLSWVFGWIGGSGFLFSLRLTDQGFLLARSVLRRFFFALASSAGLFASFLVFFAVWELLFNEGSALTRMEAHSRLRDYSLFYGQSPHIRRTHSKKSSTGHSSRIRRTWISAGENNSYSPEVACKGFKRTPISQSPSAENPHRVPWYRFAWITSPATLPVHGSQNQWNEILRIP